MPIHLSWPTFRICLAQLEQKCLHLRFHHPSTGRLFTLLMRVRPHETISNFQREFDETVTLFSCLDYCSASGSDQPYSSRKSRSFHRPILDGRASCLTYPGHAYPMESDDVLQSRKQLDSWFEFFECSASIYVGYPDVFQIDQ